MFDYETKPSAPRATGALQVALHAREAQKAQALHLAELREDLYHQVGAKSSARREFFNSLLSALHLL